MHNRLGIYVIYDVVSNQFAGQNPLMVFSCDAAAIRMFQDVSQQPDTVISTHLGDFDLLHLGTIEETNRIDPTTYRTVLCGQTVLDMRTEADSEADLTPREREYQAAERRRASAASARGER